MRIEFADPRYLFLALAVPPLLAWWLFQGRHALRHPTAGSLVALRTTRAWLARWGGALLRGLCLCLLVVALAGPRTPDLRTPIETEGIAILMVVDVSGSMGERDFQWRQERVSRLDAVKRVFRLFVAGGAALDAAADGVDRGAFEGRPTDLIGLVTFAARPERTCPLTLSHSALLHTLDAEQPRSIPGDSETNLSDALAVGLQRLESAGKRRKVLLLLTDGEHNVADPRSGWTPRQAGQIAASLKIPIYTIDAGGEPPEPSATRGQAVKALTELAGMTGGQAFEARDTTALLKACRAIDRLERADIRSFQRRRYHELYPWPAAAAFACLGALLLLEATWWWRIP